jgi:CubicO group peptidase (beta-lactamase class C family)
MSVFDTLAKTFPANFLFDNVDLPQSLDEIIRIDEAGRDLDKAQLSEKNVDKIWESVKNFYRSGAHPAIMINLRRNGQQVLNRSIGFAQGGLNQENALIATPETPVCLFSASKAFTALLVHKLAEEKHLLLSAPVAHYIPEFGAHGKERVTVDDLLRHRAGVPFLHLDNVRDLYNHELIMEQVCSAELDKLWGTWQAYHAISGGHIVAELARRVTGESMDVLLDRYFRQPMEMKYFTYGIEPQHEPYVAHNKVAGMKIFFPADVYLKNILGFDLGRVVEVSNQPHFMEATLPAANLYASASECSRFYQMMLDDGMYKGHQVVKPETIRRALEAPWYPTLDRLFKLPVRFSSGFMLGGPPINFWGHKAPNAYGHIGLLNIFCWADPDRQMSCSILTTGKAFLGPHLVQLGLMMMEINNQVSRLK